MKTSNYIITAFFTFLFGGVLVFVVAAKLHHTEQVTMLTKEKILEPFSVVIAEPGSEFTLRNGNPKIISSSVSTQDTCYLPMFELRNDTLVIFAYKDEKIHQDVEVYGLNIREIQGKENSNVDLNTIPNDSLSVNLNKARFSYIPYQNTSKSSILKLLANDSYVTIRSAHLDQLEVQLNHTTVDAWNNSIWILKGKLKNQSDLQANIWKSISVDCDSTCNFNIRK